MDVLIQLNELGLEGFKQQLFKDAYAYWLEDITELDSEDAYKKEVEVGEAELRREGPCWVITGQNYTGVCDCLGWPDLQDSGIFEQAIDAGLLAAFHKWFYERQFIESLK